MVNILFRRGSYGFEEAVFNEHAGDSLICASVSTLGLTLIGALNQIDGIEYEHCYHQDGLISLRIHPFADEDKQNTVYTIFMTIYVGVLQLANTYPNNVAVQLI